jgi:DNA mismatch repair ATPase MutS
MTSSSRSSTYQQRVDLFSSELSAQQKVINRISILRLLTALAVSLFVYLSFQDTLYLFALLVAVGGFILLVRTHTKLFRQKVIKENLLKINKAELAAMKGDFTAQPVGAEFVNTQHYYSYDLDIFGEGSLFQFVNRASTFSGKQTLAARLTSPLSSAEEIEKQQKAIAELGVKLDFRQLLQAVGMDSNETKESKQQLAEWLRQPSLFASALFWKVFLLALPVSAIAVVIASVFFSALKPFAVVLVLLQWSVIGFYFKRVSLFHDYVSRKRNVLDQYSDLLRIINSEKFESSKLKDLSTITHQAEAKIARLAGLVRALDARLNFMTNLVVNSLLMYDLQCVYRLEKWKEENARALESWLKAISEMEMLNSFSTYAYNHPDYAYATIQKSLSITATGMGHPLIADDVCVTNDVAIGNPAKALIITGANMAGKSTFLRTLGINLVLALNGAPVFAKQFACSIVGLRTGMRTADSLKDHQSYFYAELNRLHSITEELREQKPLLILLDEILKGTNSTDKQAGSIALVKQLVSYPCLSIIATHDLALGELENQFPDQVKNYHFEPTIENDELSFDYTLKRGIAEKMNATFLMKKMGIIPS